MFMSLSTATVRALACLRLIAAGSGVSVAPSWGGSNYGSAANVSGSPVVIDCDYGNGPYYTLYEGGADSTKYCSDTDRAKSVSDGRCIYCHGSSVYGLSNGWYFAKPNKYYKIPGLGRAAFHAYTSSRCKTTREYPAT